MCLRFQKEISSSGGRNNSIYLLPNNENQGRATFINQSTGRPVFLLFYIWSKWLMEKTMFHQFTVKIHIIAHTYNITQFWFDLLREGDWLQKMFAILSRFLGNLSKIWRKLVLNKYFFTPFSFLKTKNTFLTK